MIVKKIKTKISGKRKQHQIGDLVDYIRMPHNRNEEEKILHAGSRNFFADTHVGQKYEMITLAGESKYSEMPVTHWVMSWPEGENPTRQNVEELVDIFLDEMGLVGHQVIYGLHGNTKNIHLHLAINRMNESTGLVVRTNNGFDIKQAHKAIAVIENRQGWKPENNSCYKVVDGELAEQVKRQKLEPSQAAQTFEQHTGIKSAERIAQEEAHAIIKNAQSWSELHTKLAQLGIKYIKKGSGAIIEVDDTPVKASSVDRAFALGKMVKRLGEFVPGDYEEEKATHPRPPQPVSSVNLDEWRIYQEEMKKRDNAAIREQERKALEEERRKIDEEARQRQAKVEVFARKHGIFMGAIAKKAIAEERRKKKAAALRQNRANRKNLHTRPTFKKWLLQRGEKEKADKWRYRKQVDQLVKPEILPPVAPPPAGCKQLEAFNDYHKALGATRYRVTSIKFEEDGSKKAFILDKKDGVSEGFTPDELRERMDELLKLQRRRENIYYTPLSDSHNFILVDDMNAETLEQIQNDGFKPCAFIQSSPGNYQCIISIPKLDYDYDREVANRIARELNQKYGDPKLSGAVHAHRAPYFANLKEKHRKPNGKFPIAIMLHGERRDCKKTQAMSWQIQKEISKERETRQSNLLLAASKANIPHTSATSAYYAHYDNICEKYGNHKMDMSRVDAMIAVRMRANGHSQLAVEEAIRQCAPTVRDEKGARQHRWGNYAARTANYAFGSAGDIAIHRHADQKRNWERVEEENFGHWQREEQEQKRREYQQYVKKGKDGEDDNAQKYQVPVTTRFRM